MAVTIQDDFWAACKQMTKRQAADFLYAIVAFGMEGEEPQGKAPWLPTFTVVRDRVRMSGEASSKGREMARARWGKDAQASPQHDAQEPRKHARKHDAQACEQHDAQACAQHDAQACEQHDAQACAQHDAKGERESESEINPSSEDEEGFAPSIPAATPAALAADPVANPPTPDDVRTYIEANALHPFDYAHFVDTYAAQGWVRTNGRPVRDWHALARSWSTSEPSREARGGPAIAPGEYENRGDYIAAEDF